MNKAETTQAAERLEDRLMNLHVELEELKEDSIEKIEEILYDCDKEEIALDPEKYEATIRLSEEQEYESIVKVGIDAGTLYVETETGVTKHIDDLSTEECVDIAIACADYRSNETEE